MTAQRTTSAAPGEIFSTAYTRTYATKHNAPALTDAQKETVRELLAYFTGGDLLRLDRKKGVYLYGADKATRTAVVRSVQATIDTIGLPKSFAVYESPLAVDGNAFYLECDNIADLVKLRYKASLHGLLTFVSSGIAPGEAMRGQSKFVSDNIKTMFKSINL